MTREDLTGGYQTAQTGHVIAKFAYEQPEIFKEWYEKSSYLICLATKDQQSLQELKKSLEKENIKVVEFYEPDVEQVTAIAIEPSEIADKLTKELSIANKKQGKINKHQL